MCSQCNYKALLHASGLSATPNRLKVLTLIGNHDAPLSAPAIYDVLHRISPINRVTVYRILDLLVANGLVERIRGGGRAFFYGLAPNENHRPHPHFYCLRCGGMECLMPECLNIDTGELQRVLQGAIQSVEIRIDGICKHCLP
jgi:Fur family ferric uptake transcriptional regulator